jgi:hypothetical protein
MGRVEQGRLQVVQELRRLHCHLALVASEQVRSEAMPHYAATGGEQQIIRRLRQQPADQAGEEVPAAAPRQHRPAEGRIVYRRSGFMPDIARFRRA